MKKCKWGGKRIKGYTLFYPQEKRDQAGADRKKGFVRSLPMMGGYLFKIEIILILHGV